MLPMFAAIGSSLLSAGANLFAKSEMEKKQEEAKKKSIELLNRNRLSEEQINTRVNQVGNAYNTQTMEALNNQAYGIGNLLNQDLARTLTATKLAPQKAMAEVQTRENLYGINNQINNQIAQIESQVSNAPTTGEIIGGAINTGMQAYSTFQGMENQQKYIDAIKEQNSTTDFNFDMPTMGEDKLINPNMLTKPIVDKINLIPNIPRDLQNIPNKVGDFSLPKKDYTKPMFDIPNSSLENISEPNNLLRTSNFLSEENPLFNTPEIESFTNAPFQKPILGEQKRNLDLPIFSKYQNALFSNSQNTTNKSDSISFDQALSELPTKKFQSPIPILGYGEDSKEITYNKLTPKEKYKLAKSFGLLNDNGIDYDEEKLKKLFIGG